MGYARVAFDRGRCGAGRSLDMQDEKRTAAGEDFVYSTEKRALLAHAKSACG